MVSTSSKNRIVSKIELVESIQSFLEPGFTLEGIRYKNDEWIISVRFRCPLTDIGVTRSMHLTHQAMKDLSALQGDRDTVLLEAVRYLVDEVRGGYVKEMASRLRQCGIEPFLLVKDDFGDHHPPETMMAYRESFNRVYSVLVTTPEAMRRYRDRYVAAIEEYGVKRYGGIW